MTRHAAFPMAMLTALLAFFAWHMPLRGPLTDAEVDAFMAQHAEAVGTNWTDATEFEAFLRSDDGRPFVMINLMEYAATARYPDGAAPDTAMTGAEAGMLYGQAVLPQLLRRGSYPVARASRHSTIINSVGETAGAFTSFAMVRYRSRRDLIDMLASDAFQEANVHKWASLENTLVAPADKAAAFTFVAFIPVVLGAGLAVGLVRSMRARRSA